MSERSTAWNGPEQLRLQVEAAAAALQCLAEWEGVTTGRADASRRLTQCLPAFSEEGRPLDWFAAASEATGLRTTRADGALPQLLELLVEDVAVACCLGDSMGDADPWVVLRASGGGRVELAFFEVGQPEKREVLRRSDLAERLGPEITEAGSWLVAQPIAPAQEASSESGEGLSPLRRLVRLVRPDRSEIFSVALFAMATGVLLLATPVAVQALVNFVALGGALPPLIVVAFLLFLGLGFAAVLQLFQAWTVEILQRRIFVRMVADLSARLPRVSSSALDKGAGPELVNRFFDVVTIQKVGSFLLLDGLSILLSVLVGLVVLAFYHPILLAFDIVLLAVIAFIVLGPIRRGVKSAKAESQAKYDVVGWLEELAKNPNLFKATGAMRGVYEHGDRLAQAYVERRQAHWRVLFIQIAAALGLQVVASSALLGIGGLLVIQGSLTLGQLVAAELIVTLVVSSVAKTGKHIEGFYDLMAATDKVGKLLDVELEREHGEQHASDPAKGMALECVDLRWSATGAKAWAQPLNLEVRPGERVVVRGPSGSGKRALLELFWGLREPDAGFLRLDGRDLRDLSLGSLRDGAQLVVEPSVLRGSIRDNLALGRAEVSDDRIRAALTQVGLRDDVARFSAGLDTELTWEGRPLSASQVARLSIARALVANPRLILVEEGELASLEPEQRQLVLDSLWSGPWTLIIVSNDPDVRSRCDRSVDLPGGRTSSVNPEPVSA